MKVLMATRLKNKEKQSLEYKMELLSIMSNVRKIQGETNGN